MKTVYILRGISGSGKSFLAECLFQSLDSVTIVSADQYQGYYETTGEYNWTAETSKAAHEYCRRSFWEATKLEYDNIIVDNTNISPKEYAFYLDTGRKAGYDVRVITLEPDFDAVDEYVKRNKHRCTRKIILRQMQRWKNEQQRIAELHRQDVCPSGFGSAGNQRK